MKGDNDEQQRISTYLVGCTLAVVFHPVQGVAQQNADPSKAASHPERDGQPATSRA